MAETAAPKLFISYSWSSSVHEEWVLELAKSLVESGIEVLLDKWELRDGHDSIKFMESMVTNPEVKKVVILADRTYVEKANARMGGVGTETQILTPDLYSGQNEDKFVLVVCERADDGKPYVPAYYKGRIHIDMSAEDRYSTGHEQLVRWVYDKPLHIRPQIGQRPAFLDEHFQIDLGTGAAGRRCLDNITHGRPTALGSFNDYLDLFLKSLERFRIEREAGKLFDEQVKQSVDDFLPFKNECLRVLKAVAQYVQAKEYAATLHRFFEGMIHYTTRPEGANSFRDEDWDNFKFFLHELFVSAIAIFIRYERFEIVSLLTTRQYALPKSLRETRNESVKGFEVLSCYLTSLEHMKRRLNSNRLSIHADLLIQRISETGINQRELCQAEFLLYVKAAIQNERWFPVTWIYIGEHSGPLEVFARASSAQYFDNVLAPLLNITDTTALAEVAKNGFKFSSGYRTLNVAELMASEKMRMKP